MSETSVGQQGVDQGRGEPQEETTGLRRLQRPSQDVATIESLVRDAGGRLHRAETVAQARRAFANPTLPAQVVEDLVAQSAVLSVIDDEVRSSDASPSRVGSRVARSSSTLRAVAVDLETIPVQMTHPPYVRAVPYQLGAIRFGTDHAWNDAHPPVRTWMRVDEDLLPLIHLPARREAVAEAPAPARAAEQLRTILEGADSIVAYNGAQLDFPVIEELLGSLPEGLEAVDALYLAHAVWPRRSGVAGHALFPLAEQVGVALSDDGGAIRAHDALGDSTVLVRLLEVAAQRYAGWSDNERTILRACTHGSGAWRLLAVLAGLDPEPPASVREVVTATDELLSSLAPLRDPVTGHPPEPVPHFEIDPWLRQNGRTDPGRLVSAIRGSEASTRSTQAEMLDILTVVRSGREALIEAPTGTGKSAAMLAAAFDHLAAHPDSQVIISTYTRQLQRQLGGDLEALAACGLLPHLAGTVDLVKGSRNRLSLRSLTTAVERLARRPTDGDDPPEATRRREVRRRELIAYLLRRILENLTDETTPLLDVWDARSVDPADVPGLFDGWCEGRLQTWLETLSQGRSGDHDADPSEPITLRTRLTSEALQASRLIVANHALLLRAQHAQSGHDEVASSLSNERTLVLLDEAHSLEQAATSAIEVSIDNEQLEAVASDGADLLDALADDDPARAPLQVELERIEDLLSEAAIARSIGRLLDVEHGRARPTAGRGARATVAASGADATTVQLARVLHDQLDRLLDQVHALQRAVPPDDGFPKAVLKRVATRRTRLQNAARDLELLVDDLGHLCGAPTEPDVEPPPARASGAPDRGPRHDPKNRVVWVEQGRSIDFAAHGWRWLPFRLVSSPIELAEEPRWQEFRSARTATAYISGTLRVPGARDPWEFIRDRLGLDAAVVAAHLDSPFDPAQQALLLAFEDFPSWGEQPDAARRTVDHQLAGYARDVMRVSSGDDGVTRWDHGAMVLTTSRADAAGIADLMLRRHAARTDAPRIHPAVVLGNAAAVDGFRDHGGLLVGTKGLWQGVDIDDPDRLGLVWITKLPFPGPDDPVLQQRVARARQDAAAQGAGDPDLAALERVTLPMTAMDLRQAVGRLLRTTAHRGVVVISDRRLAGNTVQRRAYRRLLLGSLDEGYLDVDADTAEPGTANLTTMHEGWRRIVAFLDQHRIIDSAQAARMGTERALESFVWPEETRRIRAQAMTREDVEAARAAGTLEDDLLRRAAIVAGALLSQRQPIQLHDEQQQALRAVARGDDVLAVLPTGSGKSFIYQLPALILPGVTLVLSPLVSLMTDQALSLNRTVGGAVRALTGPMRESNSRLGKAELAAQLTDPDVDHGIRLVYLAPERLVQRQLREQVRAGVRAGIVTRIVIDEAHTLAQWGEDFRPQMRRTEAFLREVHAEVPALQIIAVTATATASVRTHLRRAVFGQSDLAGNRRPADYVEVLANPIRTDLAVFRRRLSGNDEEQVQAETSAVLERLLRAVRGHVIVYAMTVREVDHFHAELKQQVATRRIVLRYHGKLSPTEKAATLDAFISAPLEGEEGFRPMVVVATSAFGLGIDRPDIRSVVLASPPMDLAGLYQQLGRAGRDQRAREPAERIHVPVVALLSQRGWQTLQFFLRSRPETEATLRDIGERLLSGDGPVVDTQQLAETLVREAHDAGRLTAADRRNGHVTDAYRTMVVRVFALMAATGHLEDQGDFPETVRLRPGTVEDHDRLADALLAAADGHEEVEVLGLWQRLPDEVRAELGDPGGCFAEMMMLHADGHLDVNQRTSQPFRQLTGLRRLRTTLDPVLPGEALQRLLDGEGELEDVRAWFEPNGTTCANKDLLRYFGVDRLPEDTCATPVSRCSSCWQRARHISERRPATYAAVFSPAPLPARPTSAAAPTPGMALAESICALLREYRAGLWSNAILAVLRGQRHFTTATQRYELFPSLRSSASYASQPTVGQADVEAALDDLCDQGLIGRDEEGRRWRAVEHLDREGS